MGDPTEPSGDSTAQCNTLFCVADKHEDDEHVDVTGHTWHEPLSDRPVIARTYSWDE